MAGQGRTSDPRPSHFLGSWATPGAQRPAPVGTSGAALPHCHRPHQPLRYARPCQHPGQPPETRVGPLGLQEEEALPGQPRLRGVVNSDGLPASNLALVSALGQAVPHEGLRLFPDEEGLGWCSSSSSQLPESAPKGSYRSCIQEPEEGLPPVLLNLGKTSRRYKMHFLVVMTTSITSS